MDIIRFSINNPVTVIVGVILVVLFGVLSLQNMPVQLSPNVEEPVITVTTVWPGSTPYEIERDIIEEQEKVLKGIPGLYEMESTASNNRGQITLRFNIGIDIDSALLRVSNKLDQVPTYPERVDRPIINASGAESSPVMWIMLRTKEGNQRNVYTYLTYLENEIRQYFDRVPGVSDLFMGGGIMREMHVTVDPQRLANHGLTIDQVINALRVENANVAAGNLDVGRHSYRVRTLAEYRDAYDIKDVVILTDGERNVRIGDVASVELGYERHNTPVLSRGEPGINIGIRPEPNANVLELTDSIEAIVIELNETILAAEGLHLEIVNEQRPYIRGSISLLQQNIAIGGTMAMIVLLVFLRKLFPTLVVGAAIPISIIGTFIFMNAAGSSLNIVSLAGIAFAVGMLVDNAIVVLENIDRHHNMGKSPTKAAYEGTKEVWGAVLASSLTTVAVFLPVVFLEDEAGQLFRDIAIAVSGAVILSLIVSMTVIPMFSNKLFVMWDRKLARKQQKNGDAQKSGNTPKKKRRSPVAFIGGILTNIFMGAVNGVLYSTTTRIVTILLIAGGTALGAYALFPKMEYLPQGNRDLIINIMIPPPGLSYQEREEIGNKIFDFFRPYYEAEHNGFPRIRHIFYIGRDSSMILGVICDDQERTRELIPLCREAIAQLPGITGISSQAGIFQQRLGRGRTITVDISGGDIYGMVDITTNMMGRIRELIDDVQLRPVPSLDMLYPEANFVPDRERLRAVGLSAQQFGVALDVLMDGRDIGDFKQEGEKKIDLVVRASNSLIDSPEVLADALIATPLGGTVPVSALARLDKTTGLTQIRHLERDRTISLDISPPEHVTIQEAMEAINNIVLPEMRAEGLLDDVRVGMSGTADKLTETRNALQWNFVVAAFISYLLMAALLGNFIYPFIIMFTVPLAGAGGVMGLKLVSTFIAPQQMDILTMLGFIILIGIVVNNAILIVYQSLNNIRYNHMEHKAAILESVRTRLRPIYMSACTSLFGMMPLVLWPGPGSELYRGLGSVVLGGLALSTLLTVFLIPSLLMFVIGWEKIPEKKRQKSTDTATPTTAEAST